MKGDNDIGDKSFSQAQQLYSEVANKQAQGLRRGH